MYTVDEIRQMMKDRKVNVVAEAIGIGKSTLYSYLKGRNDLSLENFRKLVAYLTK